jgi:hypothetical protein
MALYCSAGSGGANARVRYDPGAAEQRIVPGPVSERLAVPWTKLTEWRRIDFHCAVDVWKTNSVLKTK